MRQIKFRGYIKNPKNELHDLILPVEELEWDIIGDELLFAVFAYHGQHWEVKVEDVELMQFTGLHDKDGVEIYEDDILQLKQTLPQTGGGTKTFISWYLITFGFYDNYRDYDENEAGYGWYLHKIRENNQKKDHISGIYDDEMFKHMTVIGNIYEHPELLQEENP